MKLNVTNNRADPLYIESRGISIQAGASIVLNNANAIDIGALKDDADVVVTVDYEAGDLMILVWEWVTLPAAPGGATTSAIEGRIVDQFGLPVAEAMLLKVGAFDDAYCKTGAANAVMDTATKGTIKSGGASKELFVETSAAGEFACTLTDAADEVVYLAADAGYGMGILDGQDIGSVEYSA